MPNEAKEPENRAVVGGRVDPLVSRETKNRNQREISNRMCNIENL